MEYVAIIAIEHSYLVFFFEINQANCTVHFVFLVSLQFRDNILERVRPQTTLSLDTCFLISFTVTFLQIRYKHLHSAEHEEEKGQEEELRGYIEEDQDEAKDDICSMRLKKNIALRICLALLCCVVLFHDDC